MQDEQIPDERNPRRTTRAGGRLPWRRDSVVLERLPLVERRHLAGQPNTVIALALGVDESTVREDIKRLNELWLEQTKADQADLRAEVVAELNDTRRRAISMAEWDEFCERAVLFDDSSMPTYERIRRGLIHPDHPLDSNGEPLRVARDEKGSAAFRGNKSGALNVARQATMDKAKVLGLIVDQVSLSKDMQREAQKVAEELGLDAESKAKLIDFASRKRAS